MDHKTLNAARRGNRAAQAALLGALQDRWFRMSVSLLGDADAARDATQETALRFLKQLKSFRGDSQLSTWAVGICLNVAREIRRDRRWVETDEYDAAWHRFEGCEAEPDAQMQAAERIQCMREALSALSERQQEAVVLRFFEELSVEQTARIMRCAPGTVKATVHQALRAMRRGLLQWV